MYIVQDCMHVNMQKQNIISLSTWHHHKYDHIRVGHSEMERKNMWTVRDAHNQ